MPETTDGIPARTLSVAQDRSEGLDQTGRDVGAGGDLVVGVVVALAEQTGRLAVPKHSHQQPDVLAVWCAARSSAT